ncbi:acyltransferase [Actinomycetes bacterium KLBMP 9797]
MTTTADGSALDRAETIEFTPVSVATSTSSATRPRSPEGRLYALDLLRFGAAMFVVAYHFVFANSTEVWGTNTASLFTSPVRTLASYGWLGVELFFLISGFVICMSCWGRSLRDFFISRVVRLVPAYLVAVLLTAAVLSLWPPPKGSPNLPTIIGNLTMMQGLLGIQNIDDPYWTLLVELKFYLLFAIVVAFGLTYRRVVLFCMLWATVAIFAYTAQFKPLSMAVEPRYAAYFVAGVALYLIHRFGHSLLLWAIVALTFAVNAVSLERRVAPHRESGLPISWKVALLFLVIFYVLVIGVALGWFSRLRWRGLVTIGALTYPLYLLHMSNGRAVIRQFRDDLPAWVLLAGVVAAALLLAYLVNRFVERPLSPILRRQLHASFDALREPRHPS